MTKTVEHDWEYISRETKKWKNDIQKNIRIAGITGIAFSAIMMGIPSILPGYSGIYSGVGKDIITVTIDSALLYTMIENCLQLHQTKQIHKKDQRLF